MAPFVEIGDLLHIEKLAQNELAYLYSAASCFVFASVGEGFGMPPCEAMKSGCPVALSDIGAHRYFAGDGALFFSPYDEDSCTDAIRQIISNSNLREDLIKKAHLSSSRFSSNSVKIMWEELFQKLQKKN